MTMVVRTAGTMSAKANDGEVTTAAELPPPQYSSRKPLTLQPSKQILVAGYIPESKIAIKKVDADPE
jgi:hypothetical protein